MFVTDLTWDENTSIVEQTITLLACERLKQHCLRMSQCKTRRTATVIVSLLIHNHQHERPRMKIANALVEWKEWITAIPPSVFGNWGNMKQGLDVGMHTHSRRMCFFGRRWRIFRNHHAWGHFNEACTPPFTINEEQYIALGRGECSKILIGPSNLYSLLYCDFLLQNGFSTTTAVGRHHDRDEGASQGVIWVCSRTKEWPESNIVRFIEEAGGVPLGREAV